MTHGSRSVEREDLPSGIGVKALSEMITMRDDLGERRVENGVSPDSTHR